MLIISDHHLKTTRVKTVYMSGWLTTLACGLKHTGLSLAHQPQVSFSFWQHVSDLASTVF